MRTSIRSWSGPDVPWTLIAASLPSLDTENCPPITALQQDQSLGRLSQTWEQEPYSWWLHSCAPCLSPKYCDHTPTGHWVTDSTESLFQLIA